MWEHLSFHSIVLQDFLFKNKIQVDSHIYTENHLNQIIKLGL